MFEPDNVTIRSAGAVCILVAILLTVPNASYADGPLSARDKALARVQACLRSNNVASRQCKNVSKDTQILLDVYRRGDKTVLPTLLKVDHLGDFFREAFVSDPDGFLTAVSELPESNQQQVTSSIGEARPRLTRPQLETLRNALRAIPPSSPNYRLARRCLRTVETENASLLVNFFPPNTFADRAGDYKVAWFSRDMYALNEKPLWPPPVTSGQIFRLTVLPAFSGPESVMITVPPDGSGQLRFRVTDVHRENLDADRTHAITSQQLADFSASLSQARFWEMSTEPPPSRMFGEDGAEWILEGVENGKYHIVDRWCPGETPFGQLGRRFFVLAGEQSHGVC